ncbi:hypothetical protein [[Scytonema hofmanni] UTEX B 1581]|uniref:hypothetical protein n=1 Tax=[Scytonema hofmanni] UTEX B 1581 TaxID=379535 RepID=UPI001640934E|nr:hypothetical protein [[Scytonema hofmanni] UTEX B 1581]
MRYSRGVASRTVSSQYFDRTKNTCSPKCDYFYIMLAIAPKIFSKKMRSPL